MMSVAAVRLEALSKRYGAVAAVDGVSLAVEAGECLALLGHNGAGKTTLFKLMLGLTRPTGGRLSVLDEDPGARAAVRVRRQIGFLPENVSFHDAMTGRELLRYYARLKDAPRGECERLLERVGLVQAAGGRIKTYSKGMRQRLGLAQALLGAPRLMLLDEPTTGLDPTLRDSFYALIREMTAAGTTVVLSSHALTELEARTDRVAIMKQGRLNVCGTLAELRRAASLPVRFRLTVPVDDGKRLAQRIGAGVNLARVNDHAIELTCPPAEKMAVLREIVTSGVAVEDIDIQPPSLDAVYAHFRNGEGPS